MKETSPAIFGEIRINYGTGQFTRQDGPYVGGFSTADLRIT